MSNSISAAASNGDRRELLVAMRTRVAAAVEDPDTPPRDLAALTRRLLEIAKEIEAIDLQRAQQGEGNAAAVPDESFDGSDV